MPIRSPASSSPRLLWHYEHKAGREEGQKDRPSVIVLAFERDADGATSSPFLDKSRLRIRPARRGQTGRQQLGDGVDKALGGFNGTCGIVGGDRARRRADAVVCNGLKFVGPSEKGQVFRGNARLAVRETTESCPQSAMRFTVLPVCSKMYPSAA